MRTRHLLAAGLLLVSTPAFAQDQQPVIVRAARMLDVTTGRMLINAAVVIQGDRVTVGVSPYDLKRGLITYRAK